MMAARRNLLKGLRIAVLAMLLGNVDGAELRSVEIWTEDGRYHLISESLIKASQDDLYAVLIDYDLFKTFTSAIIASHNVEPEEDGIPRFYTRMRGCVLLYCHTFDRQGFLLLTPKIDIVAISDPNKSDFKFSREQWQLSTEGDDTVMIYEFEMEPSFWLPPFVGPYYLKRALRSGSITAVNRIEALARGEKPRF